MPVYVYKNLNTGETFEVEQRITESALTAHPESGDPVKRIVQPVGIAFKGSGFYVNDSRASGSRSSAMGGAEDGAAKPAGGEASAPAKAEGKADGTASKEGSASKDRGAAKAASGSDKA